MRIRLKWYLYYKVLLLLTLYSPPPTYPPPWKFFILFLSSIDFFQNQLVQKFLSGISSECQTDWIQIRPDVLSGLIWVQTVCKGFAPSRLFMLYCRLLIFSKSTFTKNSFRNTIWVSNRLDPDQVRHFVGHDLGPNCLQRFCPLEIVHAFLSSADFFQNQLFQKILSGIPSECQTDWIQIRSDILSGMIWVQTVCKCYEQTTLVDNEFINQIINSSSIISLASFKAIALIAYEICGKDKQKRWKQYGPELFSPFTFFEVWAIISEHDLRQQNIACNELWVPINLWS